ncbi:MAG: APC family permease [Ferroplasma sp.]|uniref:APC family permease n=1 Tax=Ferroplasma sp. TaxID=2591003 RepID=UPI0028156C77|nr:APC family permease [Ferroplasma sp.]WMT52168.1 MAG: APC family permease [Ferroplasma sp.]
METENLNKNSIPLRRFITLTMSGIFVYGFAISVAGGYIDYAGDAAIYVGILGLVVVLLMSIPIMEYTRLAPFAGGYYGLAEMGFGKAVGKFTAILNYAYYSFLQVGNGLITAEIMLVAIYIVYGILLPFVLVPVIALITVFVMYIGAKYQVRNLARIIEISVWAQVGVMLVAAVYVILTTHNNSLTYLNPSSSPTGFAGIGLGAAVSGFLTFEAYGNGLFFSEEGIKPKKVVWRSIIVGVLLATVIGSVSIYSELAAYPNITALSASPLPLITSYLSFIGKIGVLFLAFIYVPFYFSSNIIGASGAQARLLYSLSRDNFINSKWLAKLSPTKTPANAALVNFVIATAMTLIVLAVMIPVYGYNETSLFYVAFAPYTAATILWYFHHGIPDVSLYFYYRRSGIKVSFMRKLFASILAPAFGLGIFAYAFYDGVISNFVEPYFAFVLIAIIIVVFSAGYVVYRGYKNSLGGSVIERMMNEAEK